MNISYEEQLYQIMKDVQVMDDLKRVRELDRQAV